MIADEEGWAKLPKQMHSLQKGKVSRPDGTCSRLCGRIKREVEELIEEDLGKTSKNLKFIL